MKKTARKGVTSTIPSKKLIIILIMKILHFPLKSILLLILMAFFVFENRFSGGLIAKAATLAKGVYIFETPSGHTYVGSSINLFVRVTSYFYNSILKSGTRAVLVYFFKKTMDLKVLY